MFYCLFQPTKDFFGRVIKETAEEIQKKKGTIFCLFILFSFSSNFHVNLSYLLS